MKTLISLFVTALFLTGCAALNGNGGKNNGLAVFYAVAELKPTKGNKVEGKIWFSEAFGKVRVQTDVTGLDPNSKHGFHIHEFGDCTSFDGSAAGGHFNPEHLEHAGPQEKMRHAGDLGNLEADSKGRAKMDFEVPGISVFASKNPILGRGVIVHKNADDLLSQPTGGAGARLACGVIGSAGRAP